jgi:hypothetical protein
MMPLPRPQPVMHERSELAGPAWRLNTVIRNQGTPIAE